MQRTRVETTPPTGMSGNDWAEDFFDGLGRVYKSRNRGPSADQSIVVESAYNGGWHRPEYATSRGTVQNYLERAQAAGVSWPLPEGAYSAKVGHRFRLKVATNPG